MQSVVSFTRILLNKAIAIMTCYWLAVICDFGISFNAEIWSTVQDFACHNNCIHYVFGFFERDEEVQNLATI